ncbi:hypothetical protein BG011_009309, partial [Mortierella polycephala]
MVTPADGVATNTEPINLELRALSGQRYDIISGVAQELYTITVNVPLEATGGKHSFYAYYSTNVKATSSNQFNVSGPIVMPTTAAPTTTLVPTNTQGSTTTTTTTTPSTTHSATPTSTQESDGGISGAALGGIIGGVTAFLLFIALIFFFRHRRRVRERNQHTRLEDTKEGYSETSISRSGPPAGPPSGGMMPVPLAGPGSHSPHSKEQSYGDPLTQQRMQHANGNRNPFETPDDKMLEAATMGGAPSMSPRQQHQPYQPPQYEQPPPRPQQQQQPYGMPLGMPNQTMPRSQSPFQQSNRESFDSEPESAYDPNRPRMNNSVSRNNSNPMMRGGPPGSSQLVHSSSGRSIASNPRQHMSPQPQHQNIAHPHQQQTNPFQDRELMTAAAGSAMGAAVGHHGSSNSPVPAHRPLPQNQHLNSPMSRSREIEMQPLDVQQHQYEQQQRALQRQQQQQQQQNPAAQEQQQKPVQSTSPTTQTTAPTIGAPKNPFNPTLYDDKTEVDEEGTPVYTGYRDTIFGAYAQPQGDDEDDSDEGTPMPNVPSSASIQGGNQAQQKQAPAAASTDDAPVGVQRKKSVKFTGVPVSGPIVVPDGQEQRKQRQLYHSDADEDEDEEDYVDENEDDIKLRLMATEVPSPASSHSRPTMINTTPGSSPMNGQNQNALSPVRSPNQSYGSSSSPYQQGSPVRSDHDQQGGFVPPPPDSFSSHRQPSSGSPSLNAVSPDIGDGFYEDVLAAVDKNAKTLPSSTAAMTVVSPITSKQQQQSYVPAPPTQHLHPVPLEKE